MRGSRWLIAAPLLVAGACDGSSRAVIGYSIGAWGANDVRAARDAIAATARPGDPSIVLLFDSLESGDAPDMEIIRARRFVASPDLVAVIGPASSRAALTVAPVYNEANVVQVPPTSTSRLIGKAGAWTLPLAPNDSIEGVFIATFAVSRLGARRVAMFYQNDEYGAGIRDGVRSALARLGARVIYEAPVDTTADFGVTVDAALAAGVPDLVISGARWVETGRIAQLMLHRVAGMPMVAGDGALTGTLAADVGRNHGPIYVVSFWTPDAPDSLSRAFVERYRRLGGRFPNGAEALTHDAIMVVVAAIRAVGTRPEDIRGYLLGLGRDRAPYAGVTGPITFSHGAPRLVMVHLSPEGEWERVTP